MTALLVAWNDMERTLRERQVIFWMFVSPLIFVTFFGLVFKPQAPAARVLDVVNEDSTGLVAAGLARGLEADGVRARLVDRARSRRPRLVVPAGTARAIGEGAAVELVFEAGPEETNTERALRFAAQKALMSMVIAGPTGPAGEANAAPSGWRGRSAGGGGG